MKDNGKNPPLCPFLLPLTLFKSFLKNEDSERSVQVTFYKSYGFTVCIPKTQGCEPSSKTDNVYFDGNCKGKSYKTLIFKILRNLFIDYNTNDQLTIHEQIEIFVNGLREEFTEMVRW